MNTQTPLRMSEGERLRALAALQALEREAKEIRDGMDSEPGDWPEDIHEAFCAILQSWHWTKLELEEDEGEFAHIGREFLDERTNKSEV